MLIRELIFTMIKTKTIGSNNIGAADPVYTKTYQ